MVLAVAEESEVAQFWPIIQIVLCGGGTIT